MRFRSSRSRTTTPGSWTQLIRRSDITRRIFTRPDKLAARRIVSLLTTILLVSPVEAQTPPLHWEMAAWAHEKPNGTPQSQSTSGEDWAFSVITSKNASNQPDGYVFGGYSTFPSFDDPSSCSKCVNVTKGCAAAKIFKTDLNGNVLWYNWYSLGNSWIYRVIQTLDGGFLGVGTTRERGPKVLYNPTASNPGLNISCPTGTPTRNIYVVKVDANGVRQWEYIYGLLSNPNSPLPPRDGEARDVIQLPDSSFRIVGDTADPNDSLKDKLFVMEIDSNGKRKWLSILGESGNRSMGWGIARWNNEYFVTGAQYNSATSPQPADADILVMKLNENANPPGSQYHYRNRITGSAERHAMAYEIDVNSYGEILISAVVNCNNCFTLNSNGEGTLRVYRVRRSDGTKMNEVSLGAVKAFDLWAGLARTSDGGSVVVSTKQPTLPSGGEFTHTDAYIAKLSRTLVKEWGGTYAAKTSKPLTGSGTNTFQECLYSILVTPDGGILISGNNSSNYDDDYAVKFSAASSQNVTNTVNNHSEIIYFAPDVLTFGPNATIDSKGYVDLVAGTSITITGPFEAKVGSIFEALIESGYGSMTPARLDLPGTDDSNEPIDLVDISAISTDDQLDVAESYPNPFLESTNIRFAIRTAGHSSVRIYDVLGREVARLVDGFLDAGVHVVSFDGSRVSGGMYYYRIASAGVTKTGRMILLK